MLNAKLVINKGSTLPVDSKGNTWLKKLTDEKTPVNGFLLGFNPEIILSNFPYR